MGVSPSTMSRRLHRHLAIFLLFASCFCVFNSIYGYVIVFQSKSNDCFFMFGRPFLKEFLDHPGGLLVYAGRFLGQFYHYRWLGAFVVAACVVSFAIVFREILTKLSGKAHLTQILVPCVLLVALHTSVLWLPHDTLGLTLSCLGFLGYLSLGQGFPRTLYAFVVTPALYLIAGVHVWLFVVCLLLFEWFTRPVRSSPALKVVYPLFSVALPIVAWRWLFLIPLQNAFVCPLMFGIPFRSGSIAVNHRSFQIDMVLATTLVISIPVIAFWRRCFAGTRFVDFWKVPSGLGGRLALVAAGFAVVVGLHYVRFDASLNNLVACEQLYRHRQWDALLARTKANREGDIRIQFMTDYALWRQGRLLDEMFHYPQPWGTRGLLLNFSGKSGLSPSEDDTVRGMYNSDLFYELGHANAAFRHAYNQEWATGTTYETLQRMALCCMINGNKDLAAKYLNLLERTLFFRSFALRHKAILMDPVAMDREFGDRRKWLPQVDHNMYGHPTTPLLTLFETRRDNRMAFDYLMAWMLLEKSERSLGAIAANVNQFRPNGYDSIPVHCQEALLLLQKLSGRRIDLAGMQFAPDAERRVDEFLNVLSQHSPPQDALAALPNRLRDTYPCYFFTASSTSSRKGGREYGTVREE